MLAPLSVKLPAPPCLTIPPLPPITPSKLLLAPVPVDSLALPSATLPRPASVPIVSLPPSTSVAPLATVVVGAALKRPAEASVKVTPLTAKVVAADEPPSVEASVDVSAPPPRPALAPVLPPLIA